MNRRIKKIRDTSGLTQEEFGKRIGSARNTIANYENGNRTPSNAVITSICREFGVNEAWLREGIEPMYKEKDGEFSELLSELEESDDDFIRNLITIYMELDEDSKKALRKIAEGLAKKYRD